MAVTPDELSARYPVLFHMAAQGSWPGIQKHGLLSTSRLLDMFDIQGEERFKIEESHRPDSISISNRQYGTAVVRDQKPMSESGLKRALQDGLTPREWFKTLNERVFFWLTRERLIRLLSAKAYRDDIHTVLEIDTAELLARHVDRVRLCALNSGCTKPMPFPRGRDTFLPLDRYPFQERLSKKLEPVVELSVIGGVPEIADFTIRVVEMRGLEELRQLHS